MPGDPSILLSPRTGRPLRKASANNLMMQAVQYSDYSTDPYELKIVEVPRPQPKPGQLLIRILYAGMNHIDAILFSGLMKTSNWKVEFPFIPGYEFSGIVEDIGEGISMITSKTFVIGDEVFGVNWDQGRPHSKNLSSPEPFASCFAEFICISVEKVSHKPKSVSWPVAAAMGLAGTVAYQCVHDIGYVMGDSRVLVLGGNTLVGSIVIQLAKSRDAFVASVTRSDVGVTPAVSPCINTRKHLGDGFSALTRTPSFSYQQQQLQQQQQQAAARKSRSRSNSLSVGAVQSVFSRPSSLFVETKGIAVMDDMMEEKNSSLSIENVQINNKDIATSNVSSSPNKVASNNGHNKPDLVIHYDREDWFKHPECRGFDFILDTVGEPNTLSILKESDGMIHIGAAYVNLVNPAVGLIAQAHPPFSYARFYCLNQNTAHQDLVAQYVEEGKIRIPIHAIYPFTVEGVVHMFQVMNSRRHKGKLVLDIANYLRSVNSVTPRAPLSPEKLSV